jgi:hypothetical protein
MLAWYVRKSLETTQINGDVMSTISDFYLAPVMFRKCIGLLLCILPMATQATQFESPQLDLFSVQFSHIDPSQHSSYRFDTTVTSTAANNLVFNKTSRLPAFSEFKKGTFWITSIRWHLTIDDNRASFSPLFRVESRESQIEIRPSQRSVWITWHKALS